MSVQPHLVRRRLLAAMGIDVWIRRREKPAQASVPEPVRNTPAPRAERKSEPPTVRPLPSERPAVVAAAPTATAAASANAVRDLTAVSGGGAVVVGAVIDAADSIVLQGVFRAAAQAGAAAQVVRFVWPQAGMSDGSAESLAVAYRGFLKGQASRAQATTVVLLGELACADGAVDAIDAVTAIVGPTPAQLRMDPAAKRTLWLTIAASLHA